MKFPLLSTLLLTFAATAAFPQAIPLTINYQGRVDVNGVPFDGIGQFKFAITNQAADTYYWTNDDSEPDPAAAPTASVSITVKGGLYSVNLGDTSLTNMTAVPTSVFDTPGVFLRVWFDDGTNGEQLLTPDKQLTSVPFAYKAEKVGPESITGENLARESVWPEHEGRSNTVVSYYEESNVGTPVDITTIPAGKTFVITDIVASEVKTGNDRPTIYLLIEYDLGGDITILGRFRHGFLDQGTDFGYGHGSLQVHFKAGLPVPEGAVLKVRNFSHAPNADSFGVLISGFEFSNPTP